MNLKYLTLLSSVSLTPQRSHDWSDADAFKARKKNSLMPSKTHYLQLEHAAPQYLLGVESQFLRPIAGTYVVVGLLPFTTCEGNLCIGVVN